MNESQSNPDREFAIKRLILGIVSIVCLAFAGFVFLTNDNYQASVVMAMSLRIGCLLGVIWMALPQLKPFAHKIPSIVLAVLLSLLILLAARPRIFPLIGSLIVIGGALMAISKWLQKFESKK